MSKRLVVDRTNAGANLSFEPVSIYVSTAAARTVHPKTGLHHPAAAALFLW
jgi:hypothetical protein